MNLAAKKERNQRIGPEHEEGVGNLLFFSGIFLSTEVVRLWCAGKFLQSLMCLAFENGGEVLKGRMGGGNF